MRLAKSITASSADVYMNTTEGFCFLSRVYAASLTAMWLCNPITYPPNRLPPWHVALAIQRPVVSRKAFRGVF